MRRTGAATGSPIRRRSVCDDTALAGVLDAANVSGYAEGVDRRRIVSGLDKFLGDSPLRVAIKLLVISFLVGVVMSTFGWSPYEVIAWARDTVLRAWNMGFATVDRFVDYMLLGAAIVIPVFIILRLLSYRK